MSKNYTVAGVGFFENEELPEFTPPASTVYGIIGATVSGPWEPTNIKSIKELHSTYGYALLGTGENGERIVSQAITAAERILESTSQIIFCRVGLSEDEQKKFIRESEDKLSYTIANNNTAIKSITVTGDGTKVDVVAVVYDRYGKEEKKTLAEGITKESELKMALEFEGTLTNVKVPEGFIAGLTAETPDTYAPAFDAANIVISNEFKYFMNADAVDVSVLIAPLGTVIEKGVEKEKVADEYVKINGNLIEVARERKDCIVCLDYPIGLNYEGIKQFAEKNFKNLDLDEAVTCYPAVQIKNAYTGDMVEASASMLMSKQMAYTDSKKNCWFAPAGFGDSKGVIADAVSVNTVLTKEMREELTALRINPVVKFVGQGTVIFGNMTLKAVSQYEAKSWYSSISVRRMVNYVRKLVVHVSISTLFNPNDSITWKKWINTVEPKLEEIKSNRGLEDYRVIMDRTTISEEDILNGRAPAMIYVKPIGSLDYIQVNFVLTSNSVVFDGEGEE